MESAGLLHPRRPYCLSRILDPLLAKEVDANPLRASGSRSLGWQWAAEVVFGDQHCRHPG
jgi:hypothetical protein